MKLIPHVLAGKIPEIKHALSDGAPVDEKDKGGRTALMHAVCSKNESVVRLLLDAGADPNVSDNHGYTALHFAAQEQAPNIAGLILAKGAQVDPTDEHGNTPLGRAVFNSQGRGDTIRVLLDAGADKNRQNKYKMSPVELAKSIGNYDIAKFLA